MDAGFQWPRHAVYPFWFFLLFLFFIAVSPSLNILFVFCSFKFFVVVGKERNEFTWHIICWNHYAHQVWSCPSEDMDMYYAIILTSRCAEATKIAFILPLFLLRHRVCHCGVSLAQLNIWTNKLIANFHKLFIIHRDVVITLWMLLQLVSIFWNQNANCPSMVRNWLLPPRARVVWLGLHLQWTRIFSLWTFCFIEALFRSLWRLLLLTVRHWLEQQQHSSYSSAAGWCLPLFEFILYAISV